MAPPQIDLGDCEWLGRDSAGHIGFFTSAGTLFLPEYYFTRLAFLSQVVANMKSLPSICRHTFAGAKHAGCRYADWIEAAERGLYGYDYDLSDDSGYKLLTIPERPISADTAAPWALDIPLFPGVFGPASSLLLPAPILQWQPR